MYSLPNKPTVACAGNCDKQQSVAGGGEVQGVAGVDQGAARSRGADDQYRICRRPDARPRNHGCATQGRQYQAARTGEHAAEQCH